MHFLPVIANIYDAEDITDPRDRWVAMWGGGRGVPYTSSSSYYKSAEPNLYIWHMSDDYWGTAAKTFDVAGSNIGTEHPEYSSHGASLDGDSDGLYEYGYISGALAAVDADSDGDADVIYFPVTVSYEPTSHNDPDGDGKKGLTDVLTAAFKKKEEMRGLCDELEVTYLKKDNAGELVEKLVKAMRDDLKPALEKLKAPTLKSMLAAQSLKVGGKKEELVDRLVEALA